MESVTFNCTTITPMFLAGADGRTPELRAPSIKGMMRFWWRAIVANADRAAMQVNEGELWGGSDESKGRSKVIVRVLNPLVRNNEKVSCNMLPHKNKAPMPAVNTGVKFSICISSHSSESLDDGKKALKTALLLGGFGKRSRRGYGSVQCDHWNFASPDDVLQFIIDILGEQFHINENKVKRKGITTARYPFIKEISLGGGFDNSNDVLTKIGNATHKHADDALGYAHGKDRMASPIYVSVIKIGSKYHPIITKLNPVFSRAMNNYEEKHNEFIGAI